MKKWHASELRGDGLGGGRDALYRMELVDDAAEVLY